MPKFDPIAEGATLSEDFNPMDEGATPYQENTSVPRRTINPFELKTSPEQEKKLKEMEYRTLKEGGIGATQGYLNSLIGMINLTGSKIPKFNYAPNTKESNIGQNIGEFGSYYGPRGILKGIAKASSAIPMIGNALKSTVKGLEARPLMNFISKTIKGAGEGALFSAANAKEGEKGKSSAQGAAIGSVLSSLPPAISKSSKYVPSLISKLPGMGKGSELLERIRPQDIKRAEAGHKIGINLTPLEASGRGDIGAKQAIYERSAPEASVDIQEINSQNEKNAIKGLLDKIYNKSSPELSLKNKNEIKDLYKQAYQYNIGDINLNKLKSDPDISHALKQVRKNKTLSKDIGNLPDNNIAVLDQTKRYLDDRHNKLIRKGMNNEARIINKSREKLSNTLDEISPQYRQARQKSQLKIVRNDLIKGMKRQKITGANFFKTYLANDNEFEKLHSKLKNNPEAQEHLRNMKESFQFLSNPPPISQMKHMKKTGLSQSRNYIDKIYDAFHAFVGKKTNPKVIQEINSPKWVEKYKKISLIKDKKIKDSKLADLLGSVLSSSALTELNEENKE